MNNRIILYTLVTITRCLATIYYHEPSPVLLNPPFCKAECDFGFAMGFQDTIPAKLIVGAPRSDSIGKVYSCPIIDVEKTIICDQLDIDMPKLANYSLDISPNQYFYLGSSIAATPNYFLTCAPLWIPNEIPYQVKPNHVELSDVYGTCFVHNDTFSRYTGLFEKYNRNKLRYYKASDGATGGTGWNTLFDDTNELILIAKTNLQGDILYVPSKSPKKDSNSLIDSIISSRDHSISKKIKSFRNIGSGLAAGNFFSDSTVYAFSMTSDRMTGQIAFFRYSGKKDKPFQLIKEKNKNVMFTLTNNFIGSMFGTVLDAADLNGDGYSELLVGAPARCDDDDRYDKGAVYIYIGGDMNINDKTRMRIILGSKIGARFGSAITTSDINGDEIPEIFVSSPYEDEGLGAIYILSGREIKKTLLEHGTNHQKVLSDLKFTQRLRAERYRTLGYSLKILSDLDNNGCNEIAVGSPGSDSVLLFRCIPAINVTLSTKLLGPTKFVKERAENFTVEVCVHIEHQSSSVIEGKLIVTNDITEDDAYIPSTVFVVNLSDKKRKNCNNVTVNLKHKGPGVYNFNTQTELDLLKNNTIIKTKVFNKTWVTIREDSKTTASLKVVRRCDAENCDPKLSMVLQWSGSRNFTLGSSDIESLTVNVKNNGHDSYDSCVRVNVTGAPVKQAPSCSLQEDIYKCSLSSPLERNKNESIYITLDMSQLLSTDVGLTVEVRLYELCHQLDYTAETLKILYQLTSDQIHINGSTKDRNVTDVEILDEKIEMIIDDHEYEIVNTASVTWVNVTSLISIEKRPFIQNYKISSFTETNCTEKDEFDKMLFRCSFTVNAYSSGKAIVNIGIQKDKIASNMIFGKLNTTSQMSLYLSPNLTPVNTSVTTVITYIKDRSILNNLTAIVLAAVLLAILVLAGFIFILYKANFFKRKRKERLNELRESVRRKSMKRNNSEAPEQDNTDDDVVDIEVVDESPSRNSPTTNDDVRLMQQQEHKYC